MIRNKVRKDYNLSKTCKWFHELLHSLHKSFFTSFIVLKRMPFSLLWFSCASSNSGSLEMMIGNASDSHFTSGSFNEKCIVEILWVNSYSWHTSFLLTWSATRPKPFQGANRTPWSATVVFLQGNFYSYATKIWSQARSHEGYEVHHAVAGAELVSVMSAKTPDVIRLGPL